MFILPDAKVVFLFNPRTGTHTHHALLWKHRERLYLPECKEWRALDLEKEHIHMNFAFMMAVYKEVDLNPYRVFAFYRDPEDWFASAINYMTSKYSNLRYHINMSPRAFWERSDEIRSQKQFLDPNWNVKLELFNYHDFDNETIRAFGEMGIEVKPEDIIRKNPSENAKRVLTDKDREQIRKYWHEDYEFLESKGITFPKYPVSHRSSPHENCLQFSAIS
jgi:hypothetical protein